MASGSDRPEGRALPNPPAGSAESTSLVVDDFVASDARRLEYTGRRVLVVCGLACAAMIGLGLVTHDMFPVWLCLAGGVGFGVSYLMLRRGFLRLSTLIIAFVSIGIVTVTAATGGGLHDLSALAYPVIILYAGMTLPRGRFLAFLAVLTACLLFVVSNQHFAWVPLRPQNDPVGVDLFIIAVVMGVTAYAVSLLASDARKGIALAYREIERRRETEKRLEALSTHDALTGLYSRHFFNSELARLEHTRRYPVSVIAADIDGLKAANDRYGHPEGDRLLIRAAEILTSVVRVEDVLARLGGDEFAILLPETDSATAADAVARIERKLAEQTEHDGAHVSLSIGNATSATGGLADTLARADSLMYAHKAAKRADARL